MKNMMSSVAVVALIATTGFAMAQGAPGAMKSGDAPAASPPAANSSPKAETAPMNAPAPKGAEMAPAGPKAGATAQEKVDTKTMPKAAEDKSATPPKAVVGSDTKASGDVKAGSKPATAESATPNSTKSPTTADSKTPSAATKTPTADSKIPSADSKTTGNAATSATVAPPAEKQTQIVSAIKQEKIQETTNINFNISIGTAVPSTVRFYPLPPRIVEIYPEWRGYDFILVRGRYVILRPRTHEIIYIIEG